LNPLVAGVLVSVVGFGLVGGAVELSRSPQLIAFVAAPKADAEVAALAPQSEPGGVKATDAVFRLSTQFRATETKAIAPVSHDAMAHVGIRSLRGGETSAGMTDVAMTNVNSAASRAIQVNVAAPIPAMDVNVDPNVNAKQAQGFLVLTTWEAVQTSSPNSRTVADYEMDSSDQEQTDQAATQPDSRLPNKSQPDTNQDSQITQGAQITVTRMILVFYPASAYPASAATGVQPAPTTGSPSHRPAPSYGGWLFFQL
jgi:hypothetical protein